MLSYSRSFTEDESSNEGQGYSGWEPIEVRARATQVVGSAVLYGAHATLQRGFAVETGQGHAYITGKNQAIERFVESDAAKASVAHLVSGYRDSELARNSMLLGSTSLYWFKNTQPTWWSDASDNRWVRLPNNTNPTTHSGLNFWSDVCASWCVRRFDDDSEFMEIDMTTTHSNDNHGTCACYAFQDVNVQSTHANKTSHAAPDDALSMEFLHRHHKIADGDDNNVHVFAMKKHIGRGLFVPELQSTVYYSRLLEKGIDVPSATTLQSMADATRIANNQGSPLVLIDSVYSTEQCISQCAKSAVGAVRSLRTVRYKDVDKSCYCFETSFFAWPFDTPLSLVDTGQEQSIWERVDESTASDWFDVEFCRYVRPDTVRTIQLEPCCHYLKHHTARLRSCVYNLDFCPQHGRSMVYSKNRALPARAEWCAGSPVGAGYVLKSGSVMNSYNQGTSSAVRCHPYCPHVSFL